MNNLKVLIPLKTNSVRVANKNLRPFVGGKSLFDIKIEQLLKCIPASDIYVSSENLYVKTVCERYGVNFLLRDVALTPNSAPWIDVVSDAVGKVPPKADIMWVQVTQPLFADFGSVIQKWESIRGNHDSLVVVKKVAHHIIDAKGHPINFEFGYWHRISQELPSLYEITWACFCMKREMVDRTGYQIGRTPYLFETEVHLVDIDTEQDFEVAGVLYNAAISRSKGD